MFLTQCPLNPGRRSTRELLSSPQRLHAAVLGCFLPGTADAGRILWRLDRPDRHRFNLYVTSPVEPSMESLIDQAGWPNQPEWRTADYEPFLARLQPRQRWLFRLAANPVANVRPESGGRGERVSVVKAHRIREDREGVPPEKRMRRDGILSGWLARQGERHGFAVADGPAGRQLRVVDDDRRFDRHSDGTRRSVTLATASFEGVLEVTDAVALRAALVGGIGPAKGYGCGLMTLAKVP